MSLSKLEQYKIKLQKTLDDILSIPISQEILSKAKGFQIPHIQNIIFALRVYGVALDASDTGTGKTYSTVAACVQENLKILVICPKSVIPTWFRVCEMFGVDVIGVINYESIKNGKYYTCLDDFEAEILTKCPYIQVIKVDAVNNKGVPMLTPTGKVKKVISQVIWKMPNSSIVIFDESHKGKNGTGNNKNSTGTSRLVVSI